MCMRMCRKGATTTTIIERDDDDTYGLVDSNEFIRAHNDNVKKLFAITATFVKKD